MKKLIVLIFIIIGFDAYSQNKEAYAMIIAKSRPLSHKVAISVDFGEEKKYFSDARLKDEEGKVIRFNSIVDALNFMNEQGWIFVDSYVMTVGNQNVYHYLLKRQTMK